MTTQAPQPGSNPAYSVIPKIAELTSSLLFGEIWERPQLSKRDRSMITVAVLTALYRTDQLRGHMRRALANGVTREELAEIVTHITFYSGWPCGVNAGSVLKEVLEEG